jgi:hypothetical protein
MTRRYALIGASVLVAWSAPAAAQSYRARVDARAQAVSFRGLTSDSVLATSVVTSPTGGLETPDGFGVRCSGGDYCFFFRPGPELRGVPVTTSASVILWGFGVQGLTVRATGRFLAGFGDDVWPGTEPPVQLLEGLVEYQRGSLVARGGRQLVASRLEAIGFDGAWVKYRFNEASLEVTGYGGAGLARAAAVPISSPALNPLDEFRPRERQIVAGAEAAWFYRSADIRGEYRREIDPKDKNVVSERAAISFGAPAGPLRATGGFDYNMAEGRLGNADITLMYQRPRFTLSGGARRYRPYFSLWTLWSAFSPVPHNGVNAFAQIRATSWLSVRARGEAYRYEDAGVSTALVTALENEGWRASTGAIATLSSRWTVSGDAGFEHGPGASSRFADGEVRWAPNERYGFGLYGGAVARPLELRYYDATGNWVGGRGEISVGTQRRVWADVSYVDDARDRPDAGASSLTQFRLRTGLMLSFGSAADRLRLPPARPLDR